MYENIAKYELTKKEQKEKTAKDDSKNVSKKAPSDKAT